MKKYAILAIAIVLVVLFAAVSVDAFSFKFFKPVIKIAKVTPTSTSKAPAQSSGFCGWSSYGFCNYAEDCVVALCGGSCFNAYEAGSGQGSCGYQDCFDTQKYKMECGCTNNKCQWTEKGRGPEINQGQGQGTSQSAGQGNGQSSQGQQGQGMGEGQSQSYGEGGSFQCLDSDEEQRCTDSEGVHQYCTGADGCYTKRDHHCEADENGIQKCVASAVAAVCLASC